MRHLADDVLPPILDSVLILAKADSQNRPR